MAGMRTHFPIASLILAAALVACGTDPEPLPGPSCELPAGRLDWCKEACAAGQICPGLPPTDQPACELECRACAPELAWCPSLEVGQ